MNEPCQWRILVTSRAGQELKGLTTRDQTRIRRAIDALAADPRRSDIAKLRGVEDEWRLRVGDWRMRFRFETSARIMVVLSIRHRREAYRE